MFHNIPKDIPFRIKLCPYIKANMLAILLPNCFICIHIVIKLSGHSIRSDMVQSITGRFVVVYSRVRMCFFCWTRLVQSTSSHYSFYINLSPMPRFFNLSLQLRLSITIPYTFVTSPMRDTYPTQTQNFNIEGFMSLVPASFLLLRGRFACAQFQ